MPLKDLTKRVRRYLSLTQEQFAQRLDATSGSVQNWESGRKRPAPGFLKKMADLAPAFAREIDGELRTYEWHQKDAASGELPELQELPADCREQILQLSKKHALDTSVILIEALRTGLAELSRGSSTDLKTLVKHQADINRKVSQRELQAEPSRKRRRSKVA